MNLVVQGRDVCSVALKALALACAAAAVEQIDAHAYRLVSASPSDEIETLCHAAELDWAWIPAGRRLTDYGLFVSDMDSTIINIECIDEVADMYGMKHDVAAITEAAMRGEINFRESLARRVSLLAGLSDEALAVVYEQRLNLNPGAERLMQGLKQAGIYTVLVSGGFTYFTERLKRRLGFDEVHANELEVHNGRLTGRIVGPIIDAEAKANHLRAVRERLHLGRDQVIAAGDGANDIPMLAAAGLGVAYRAKPIVHQVADCRLDHAGLDGILKLFG
ncbi:MAG: phosphoserine phosphatase SerB [Rhodocyclales bacterium]|nr:phosphoserine phosphatase SerB [Rhodocyclales bacterium]